MRYLKLASAKNPSTDFIELNDFNGFLCTSFQNIGISRKLEFLSIKNRQFSVDNKPNFKKYSLIVQILSKYSEYDAKHRELITFLDRNKKDGFRLYFRPYNGMDLRYCLCDIETSVRAEKMQPVVLTLVQNSLWLSEEKKATTSQKETEGSFFVFDKDESVESVDGYYSVGFYFDSYTDDYNIAFYSNVETQAEIVNNGYNEIPLKFVIYGSCVNPVISLFNKNGNVAIKRLQVYANIDQGYYLEINANILENGVWYVNASTGEKVDYSTLVNNELGSPYFYIDNGEYYIVVEDDVNSNCICDVFWQEEYSE